MHKPIAESCLRNQQAIADTLQPLLSAKANLLEIASGTGQHAVYCCQRMPHIRWQTSELPVHHQGIKLWLDEAGLDNLLPPITLDVDHPWPSIVSDHIFTANSVHFIAQSSVENMFFNAAKILPAKGLFIIYGPVNIDGQYTSAGNARLDAWLKQSVNPLAGIKDLAYLEQLAHRNQLQLVDNIMMPANNHLLIFSKALS